tara:strand:+ start:663 stop:1127 length:465 start_codon:yes stop_codon:yes gene_type:complete
MKIYFDTYKPKYASAFEQLNLEWLEEFFYVEPYDKEVLQNVNRYILKPGGYILVALDEDKVIGVVALMKLNNGVFELTKMAVDSSYRGNKIGQKLMQYCLDFSKERKIDTLILYSNRLLENAIYIYRKFGFIEVPLEKENPYERANIKMKLELN